MKSRLFPLFWLCCGMWLVVGCTGLTERPTPSQASFFYPKLKNYRSSGRILMVNQNRKYAGNLTFRLSDNEEMHLSIAAPILGSSLYEVRANAKKFMILDFQEEIFVLDENNAKSRQQWLGADISLTELSWVVWGRIPRDTFEENQVVVLENDTLELSKGEAQYHVTLSENGLLKHLVKKEGEEATFDVTIQEYQMVGEQSFPRKLQILRPESQERLVLVMNDINPNLASLPALTFIPPDGMKNYGSPEE